ncbi:hypothetical protein CIL05_02240 [Virgibacillus profundi]|uniref:DUF4181 domain-containing protein n=1 Tax=Virgibacillus profundi TaxID=2024555 RepID=A0A2A2IJK3_9BACI|nr:DUF4181 domain-containing protein [Virgibacillus profundi]PAV31496.1 hypothetical protein CIL05_02240 [Virgibacillus profundi]PXY55682.1 DUF4181 domain-containing protein [Virgibacillus profundi]
MIPILIILIAILILDQFINRRLIKKWDMQIPELEGKYVNKLHKYGERILYWISFIVMIIAINEFPHLRILIFLGMAIMFAFRTIMKWNFTRENKTYLLSAVTCGLFIMGSVVYGLI